jgi:LPXTG-motif cell wall-anchored protein
MRGPDVSIFPSASRLIPATAFLFAATLSLGMAAAPVAAPDILVSSDGVTFGTSLSEGMFDDRALVPTSSIDSELWIRNPASSAATVRISLADVDLGSGVFADNLTLTSFVERTGATRSATLSELRKCNVIVASETVPGRGTLKVRFTAALGDLHGLEGQNEAVPLDLKIDLRDGQAGEFPDTPCEETSSTADTPGSALADTGTDSALPLTTGGALLVSGILLLLARRRTRGQGR